MHYLKKLKFINLAVIIIFCILISLVYKINAYGQDSGSIEQDKTVYSKGNASALIDELKERLETIDEDADHGRQDDRLRNLLNKQISVANELISMIEKNSDITSENGDIDEELNNKKRELDSLFFNEETVILGDPNQDEFDLLTQKVKDQRKIVTELKTKIGGYDKLVRSAPEQQEKMIERGTKAGDAIETLNDKILLNQNPSEKELLVIELAKD